MKKRFHKSFKLKKLANSLGLPKVILKEILKLYEQRNFDLKEVESTFFYLEFLNKQKELNNIKIVQEFYKEHKFDYLFSLMKDKILLEKYKEYYGLKDVIVNNNKQKKVNRITTEES